MQFSRTPDSGLQREYGDLLERITQRREETLAFLRFLETETDWLTCPASISHHLNVPGGLIEHSLMVARTAFKLNQSLGNPCNEESLALAALFHDVGKIGAPGKPLFVPRPAGSIGAPYEFSNKAVAMGLGVNSLYLCASHLTLTDEEAQAICYHDGQYVDDNRAVKNRERPLTLLLHMADLWSSHVDERKTEELSIIGEKESP